MNYNILIKDMKKEMEEINIKLLNLDNFEDSIEKRKNKEILEYRKKEITESITLLNTYLKKLDYKEMVKKYENSIGNSEK